MNYNFYPFCKVITEFIEYSSCDEWKHYYIDLPNDMMITILVGQYGGFNNKEKYSIPIEIHAEEYTQICISISRKDGVYAYTSLTPHKVIIDFNNFPADLASELFSFKLTGNFYMVPIEFLFKILEYFGIAKVSKYCNICGIKLRTEENLCWACKHGI